MERRLYKSKENRQLAGVCGGVGEYFNIDPVIVRLLVVAFTLAGGAGLIAYIVAAIIIPERDAEKSDDYKEEKRESNNNGRVLGVGLIILGGLVLLSNFAPWIPGDYFFAIALVVAGIYFVARKQK